MHNMVVGLLSDVTESITRECVESISGASALPQDALRAWSKALQSIIQKFEPIHVFLDIEALEKERGAFFHTANLVLFVADALWNGAAKPVMSNLFDAPVEVHSF